MKILVIEDSADFRDALSLMFEMEGFETRSAGDGQEGFAVAQTEHPDLIVTDIEMPNLDGIEMIKLIRQKATDKTVPIIAVTAYQGYMQSQALEAGANCTLSKPIQFDLLYDMTTELLRNSA